MEYTEKKRASVRLRAAEGFEMSCWELGSCLPGRPAQEGWARGECSCAVPTALVCLFFFSLLMDLYVPFSVLNAIHDSTRMFLFLFL